MQITKLLSNQKDGLRITYISFRYIWCFIIYLLFILWVLSVYHCFTYFKHFLLPFFIFQFMHACLWSPFNPVWLCDLIESAMLPLSMGYSRQEYWSGLPPILQGIFWPRNQTCISYVSCIVRWVFYHWRHLERLPIYEYYAIILLYALQFHYHFKGPCYSLKT